MAKYAYHRVDANAADLYDYAEALGLTVERIGVPCDAIVGAYGFTVAVEVKTEKGKLRDSQVAFMRRFSGAVTVWRTREDVKTTRRWLTDIASGPWRGLSSDEVDTF